MTRRRDAHACHVGPRASVASALILTCIVALVAALPTAAGTASPSPASDAGGKVALIARGPFGSVAGRSLSTDDPLPDPATLEALDAYGRGARVTITPTAGSFEHWRVTASREPSATSGATGELGTGENDSSATIQLPASGLYLVRLDGTIEDPMAPADPGTAGSWVWRIGVPDRDVPGDGDPYPPMPAIVLTSGDRSVELDPGSACFIGTCGDIGATSPPQTLPTIRTLDGAPLIARLSDGSGIAAWSADATPVGATDDETVPLGFGADEPPAHSAMFAAPSEGRWVILVHVRFDRARGAADGYGRLILE